MKTEWQDTPPKEDGDYYYSGNLPDGEYVFTIVQIFTHPRTGERAACTLIPPGWRGDMSRIRPVIHFDRLDEWTGEWQGQEGGLCCYHYHPSQKEGG